MAIDLREALALHQKGELDQATRLYEAALEADPNRDIALHLLGMVANQRGNPRRAVELIGRAIALRSNVAEYHGGIAEAYWALGQLDRAILSGREALRLSPGSWQVRCNLGSSLVQSGRVDEAIELFREAIRLQPNFSQAYNNLGHALQIKGDSAGAVEHYRIAIRLNPASSEAHANLGKILLDRGESDDALKHCREATRLRPDSPDAHNKLGNVFHVMGRLEEADACFRRAIELAPHVAAGYASLGANQEHLGELEESLVSYREALRLDPRHAGVLAKLATRYKDQLPEADLAAIESLLARPELIPDQRLPLLFGMAHVFDARKEFDRAALLSIEANAGQHADFEAHGLGYDSVGRANEVDHLIDGFDNDFFQRVRNWGLPTNRPVFVVGMPRSGTSLVEQILASHSQVFGAGELRLVSLNFRSFVESLGPVRSLRECLDRIDQPGLERLARSHLDSLEKINDVSPRIIDKMPENTLYLGLIAALFPNARVIHCRRDSRDTALSCWMTNFSQVRWSCHAGFIATRINESARLMEHWRKVLPIPIFDIDYEDLVNDFESGSRALVKACGLDWEPACLEFHKTRRHVRTASVRQVRQPIYRASIGRWKNYEKSLDFLFQDLAVPQAGDHSRTLDL